MSKASKQVKRFGISVQAATEREAYRNRLCAEAQNMKEGTEARKRLKKLAEHEYQPQVIPSNDFSCTAYSKRSGNTEHGPVRASGKTDRDSVRYFSAKRGIQI